MGGALWSWVYGAVEYVGNGGGGQSIQSALYYLNQDPVEAGDQWANGSPIASAYNSGLTQVTRSIPIDWNPQGFGGAQYKPVIYPNIQLGKNVTLNYNGMGPVAEYQTHAILPTTITNAIIQAPVGYMPLSIFNTFYTFDAGTNTLHSFSAPSETGCYTNPSAQYVPPSGYGGVIVSSTDGSAAMGVYAGTVGVGGSISFFCLIQFPFGGSLGRAEWDAEFGPGTISAGDNSYNVWITTGSLSAVEQNMRSLYQAGTR